MKTLLIIVSIFSLSFVFAQDVLIENIAIVDVEKGELTKPKNVFIQDGLIVKISNRPIKVAAETTVIEGTGKYLMPGMIDTHIHFFQTGSLYTRPDAIDMTDVRPYEEELQFAEEMVPDSFKRYLRLGVTSIMDVGGPFSNFKVRDSVAEKHLSPNVYVTGPLFSPYQPEALSKLDDVPIVKITSEEEATALFNKMLPYKPDFIKIWYIASAQEPAEKNYGVVAHIAKLAHENGLKLAVHATQKKTAELAVKAGADILVHSIDDVPADDAFAQLLIDNDVTYIPTLIVSKNYVKAFLGKPDNHEHDLYYANPETYKSMLYFQKYNKENITQNVKQIWDNEARFQTYYDEKIDLMGTSLKLLNRKGVTIAAGTDAGNIGTMHASSYLQELEAMQKAGLTPPEILKTATYNAAKGFGLLEELGTVSEGKKADLLILSANPLAQLENLKTIETTLKEGVALSVSEIIEETPEQIVQRQVNAYNARNIEAFMDTYADDIKIYNFPDVLSMDGKEQMRQQFSAMFESVPNLYCEIKNRIVLGNKVVDREYVRFGETYSSVIAIYEVTNGKISKVTFLR
ncbi:MAG TPA: amidohydrolase [Flavobacteriaceae bacterium]|nr:amidohydrolase [Flavobacteriaceae bacterium]MAY52442.1 amidohydrolase [Flavobacteriaceae bacterium]HBR52930.1 amidohydrolase [Flavobacteriaceae bacterium]HIB48335.1 amidohydrolase [Flavobacteriaceae bacterium]HIN99787.1 amidohydrolase [Flavobacteriaceae bacterium]